MQENKENKRITIEESDIIWREIEKAQKILMHLHPSPDGDSVGSTLAMFHALKAKGKDVTVIKGDSDLPSYLKSTLPGFDI
jgi:phosphoesterase RecJ-like protein